MAKALPLDFHVAGFSGEVRENLGEDYWAYGFTQNAGIIAVFDGCGGSGARTHPDYGDHSEAYMASRLCAGALYECMQEGLGTVTDPVEFVRDLIVPHLSRTLRANVPEYRGGIRIKGMRTLPTTMAAALIQQEAKGMLAVTPIWAGDSRVYILDETGLSQLTVDDSNQPDPMEGLYDDGTLTNVVCQDQPIRLNCRTLHVKPPFMVLAASDGCFGYVSTPMEFEGMLLHTLLESENVAQWEEKLRALIAKYAGDDHTLFLASFGYNSFENIQKTFQPRYEQLQKDYLQTVWATPWEDRDTRRQLWATYRENYLKYMEDDAH